jgi:triosephosphate isomerase (TIM)
LVNNISDPKLPLPLTLSDPNTEVVIAPPSLYLLLTREHLPSNIEVAAQNVFDRPNGAFTGEISVAQLVDSGITWTILGHSERRTLMKEEDSTVACKTKAALDGGIGVIVCCGESLEEREKGVTVDVVTRQLDAVNRDIGKDGWDKVVIAYEPIWAIGTGKVATTGMLSITDHIVTYMLTSLRASTRSPRRNPEVALRCRVLFSCRVHSHHLRRQCV